MLVLIAGLAIFFIAHSVRIVAPAWRQGMIDRHGQNAWRAIYSVASIAGLVLIVWGYGLARLDPVILYTPPVWMRHLTLVLMMPVFVMFVAAYIPGRIRSTLKHPMLASVKLWAFAHLLANGTLADVLLFGSFLAWAVFDRISAKHRPAPAPAAGPAPPAANDLIAVVIGATIYVVFLLFLHQWLFGVSPLG